MNNLFSETFDEYLSIAKKGKVGQELIIPLMTICELKRIADGLSWLAVPVKEEYQ